MVFKFHEFESFLSHSKKFVSTVIWIFFCQSTLLRCLGGAKSSFDFLRLSLRIIRAAANAIFVLLYFLFSSAKLLNLR